MDFFKMGEILIISYLDMKQHHHPWPGWSMLASEIKVYHMFDIKKLSIPQVDLLAVL